MKILKWLDNYLELTVSVFLMSLMTVLIFLQVVMRYVMHNSLSWSEELARYTFVWLIYIAISYGSKLMKHIKIDAGLSLFPKKSRPYIVILGDVLFLLFALYIVYTGSKYTLMQIRLHKTSAALGIPMDYITFAPVTGFALVTIRQIQTLAFRFGRLGKGDE